MIKYLYKCQHYLFKASSLNLVLLRLIDNNEQKGTDSKKHCSTEGRGFLKNKTLEPTICRKFNRIAKQIRHQK